MNSMALYCNYVANGDYPLFARMMFNHVGTHLVVLIGVPFGIWLLYRIARWTLKGFRPA
jgi:hypothetical protein